MNSLSWLLYGADVASSLKGTALPVAIFGVIGGVLGGGFGYMMKAAPLDDTMEATAPHVIGAARLCLTFGLVAMLISPFIPSRNTIMLIAASEVGETVLASPEAQQIGGEAGALATDSLRVLRKFINEQLADGETE
jgi:hypothetical protein